MKRRWRWWWFESRPSSEGRLLRVCSLSYRAADGKVHARKFSLLERGYATSASTHDKGSFEDVVLVDGAEHLIDDPHRCLGSRLRGLRLIPNAITPEEHDALVQELDPLLRAKPYATDHWDDVIADYRETERSLHRFAPANRATLQRLSERWLRFPAAPGEEQPPPLFPHVHVLDLHQRGRMRSHVDSVKFSGGLVAGLSLLSPCVMTLRFEEKEEKEQEKEKEEREEKEKGKEEEVEVRMLLPPRSFYVLSASARYEWGHGIAAGEQLFLPSSTSHSASRSQFYLNNGLVEDEQTKGVKVRRERRISIIFRDFAPDLIPPSLRSSSSSSASSSSP